MRINLHTPPPAIIYGGCMWKLQCRSIFEMPDRESDDFDYLDAVHTDRYLAIFTDADDSDDSECYYGLKTLLQAMELCASEERESLTNEWYRDLACLIYEKVL